MLQVLSSCNREEIITLLRTSKDKILSLGKYIGINYYRMGEKLYEAIASLAKSMRSD